MADASIPPNPTATAPEPPRPVGTFAPFRYRGFREIWLGNALSQIGSQLQAIGAAWLMTDLSHSHAMVAAVQASNILPMLFLGVFAGAIADNFDRRRVMLLAQWFMVAVSTALAVLAWQGALGPWGLLAFTLAVGAGITVNMPAWQASVRAMVDRPVMPQAISLNSIAFNLARTVGPAIGGLVLATGGVATAFALNALSYVALIVALIRWRPEVAAPVRGPLLPSIKAGVQFCTTSVPVRRILLHGSAFAIGVIAFQALLPVVVRDGLHGDEAAFGLLLGLFGTGSVCSAFLAPGLRRRVGLDNAVAVGAAASVASLVGSAFAPSVAWLAPFPFLGGIGWTLCLTTLNVALQVRAPETLVGRCMAIYHAVAFGSAAVGAWCWGLAADATSVRSVLLCAAAWIVCTIGLLRIAAPLPRPGEGVVFQRG